MIKYFKAILLLWCFLPCMSNGLMCQNQLVKYILGTDSMEIRNETDSYIVYTPAKGKGYVIVSKNGKQNVLGYSKESIWDEKSFPIPLQEWLHACNINNEKSKDTSVSDITINDVEERYATVQPLLTTHWHQKSPYNNYAPIIEDGNIKTVAGCVAIAAAQITYYWWRDNPSVTLKDTPIYPYGGAPITYSIPKGTPNDWELIYDEYDKDSSESSKDAVARLCYVIGTSSFLDYASSTSGHIIDAANAMYSQYNISSEYLSRASCNQEEWELLFLEELSHGRPVLCSGSGSGGHAFVLDGYDNETGLFHFNFGWGGTGDGYYPIDDSETSMGGYHMNQSVVYNIHPGKRNIDANMSVTQYENNDFHIYLNIINKGTLPASVRLICCNENGYDDSNSILLWQTVVNNDNEYVTVEVDKTIENSGEKTILSLIDEYNTRLCSYEFDVSKIYQNYYSKEGHIKRIYGVDGVVHKNADNKGIYLIQDGIRIKKIIK